MRKWAFDGVRILGCTQYVATTAGTSLLADLGAEVIKIESHHRPDPGRVNVLNPASFASFPDGVPGEDWWNRNSFFNSINRGQRSLTLDLTNERGRELFREVAQKSDIVIESFTPRVMAKWNMDYEALRAIKPDIIMLSLTGFGHGNGPYTDLRGTATVLEATQGHAYVTGYKDGPPGKAGAAYVDYIAAWSMVFACAGALRHRMLTGEGQWIDMSLYQIGALTLSDFILDYEANGRTGGRMGDRDRTRFQNCYRTRGHDAWIAISIGSDEQWDGLCEAMQRPDLRDHPDYATQLARLRNQDALDKIITEWTSGQDKYELFKALQARRIPAMPVLNARDLCADPHLRARQFLQKITFAPEREMEPRFIAGHPWRFNGEGPPSSAAPMLGEHNRKILGGLLGLSTESIDQLEKDDIIGSSLADYPERPQLTPEQMLSLGYFDEYDAEYRRKLSEPV